MSQTHYMVLNKLTSLTLSHASVSLTAKCQEQRTCSLPVRSSMWLSRGGGHVSFTEDGPRQGCRPRVCGGWEKDTATGHQRGLVVHARPLQAFCVKPKETQDRTQGLEWRVSYSQSQTLKTDGSSIPGGGGGPTAKLLLAWSSRSTGEAWTQPTRTLA